MDQDMAKRKINIWMKKWRRFPFSQMVFVVIQKFLGLYFS